MAQKKSRILFFDEAVAFGGSVVVLSHLFKHMDRGRFEPKLVSSLDDVSLGQLFNEDDILCHFKPALDYSRRARWMQLCPHWGEWSTKLWAYSFSVFALIVNMPAYVMLLRRVLSWRPHLIHINNGKEGFLVSRLLGVPAVLHVHGVPSASAKARHNQRLYPEVASFICISKYISAKVLDSGIDAARVVCIPNPAPDFEGSALGRLQLREHYGFTPEDVVVMHAGRLIRWKGQLEFLRAFANVAHRCDNVKALVVGDDVEGFTAAYPNQLVSFVESNKLGARVVFTGHVNNVQEHMAAADIAIHSSIEPEPFGLVITEAMAAGVPVIAADDGAPSELVESGISGFLVNPKDTLAFADAIERLVMDSGLRIIMGVAGRAIAKERFAAPLFARHIEDVYGSVLKK